MNWKRVKKDIEDIKKEEIIINKRENKQKIKKIGMVVILCLLVLLGLIYMSMETSKYTKDNIKFAQEYTNVGTDNVFVYKSLNDIAKILENGTGIVYLGFPECKWCQAYVPYLNQVARSNSIEKIYYCDILKDREQNSSAYKKVVELLDEKLGYDDEGNKRVFVPDVTFVLKGKIVGHNNETSTISGGVTPKEYWTEDKITNIKLELTKYISLIKDDNCSTCNK